MMIRAKWLVLVAAWSATGCVSSSMSSDVARVRELTRIAEVEHVAGSEVADAPPDDIEPLLARPLDAASAVRIAILNNRELRATLRELGIARGQLIQAGVLPNPTVEAELLPERNSRIELRVEYNITALIFAGIRSRAEAPHLDAERYRVAAEVVDLGYRVRAAFYDWQASEKSFELGQRTLDAMTASRDAARALERSGNLTELELASEEVAFERARIDVAKMELAAASAKEALQRLLGLHGAQTSWQATSEIAAVPPDAAVAEDLETQALRSNLDLRSAKEELESLARRASVARNGGWVPDITADVHALQGNPASDAPEDDRDWRFGAGVSVDLPVFDHKQGESLELESRFDAALERYYGKAVQVRSAAREIRAQLLSAHARALQYQNAILPAQARVNAQMILQYNAMQASVFDVIRARREELDLTIEYVMTLAEYWRAQAALDALLQGRDVTRGANPDQNATGGE